MTNALLIFVAVESAIYHTAGIVRHVIWFRKKYRK